jgi:hypothetical protein
MAYFRIHTTTEDLTTEIVDFSQYVNKLSIQTNHIYKSSTNASGNTSVRYINSKKVITVGIIPLNASVNKDLLEVLNSFKLRVEYLDPVTGELERAVCILPKHNIEYYTIQADKVQTKAYILTFEEL